MWEIIAGLLLLIIIAIVGVLIFYKIIPNPITNLNLNNPTNTNNPTDTNKLSNQDLIQNIKKNAATDELAQSYLDGGEINLESLSNNILQKLFFMKGVELRYAFGIIPVIIDTDYDFVINSYNKDTSSFGGIPSTDKSSTEFAQYIVIRDKVDKLKRLWKTTTSSPYPENDQIFYNNIIALN